MNGAPGTKHAGMKLTAVYLLVCIRMLSCMATMLCVSSAKKTNGDLCITYNNWFSCHILLQFITDITATIDEAKFKDPQKIMKILQPYKPEKNGSCYIVQGTYEKLEEIFLKLQREHISTHVRSVDVSAAVMVYIEKKCKNELSQIQGNSFVIETQPGPRTGTVQVTLRPRHVSISLDRANMVRQRFITFYQRTASDLQVTSVTLSPHKQDALQKRFPQLLFEAKQNKTEVTGPFMHVARLTEFIFQHTSTSRKSHNGRADGGGSRTSTPSPKQSKVWEDESCPICMDPIVTTKKVTLRCKHSFCKDCLKTAFDYKPVCPTCGELYGTLTGTQPDGGIMNFNTTSSSLPGYEKHGTIIIKYYIPSGIQKVRLHNTEQVTFDIWSSILTN